MARTFEAIDDGLAKFIGEQHLFFVATAPAGEGHVNLSPKGLDSFRVIGPTTVAWLDVTGSGIETIAHLRDDGRVTVMFCAFSGSPRILRLFGRGRAVLPGDPDFDELVAQNGRFAALARAQFMAPQQPQPVPAQ